MIMEIHLLNTGPIRPAQGRDMLKVDWLLHMFYNRTITTPRFPTHGSSTALIVVTTISIFIIV